MTVATKAAKFQALAERLISENATAAVIRKPGDGQDGTPWSPTDKTNSDTDLLCVPIETKTEDMPRSLIGIETRTYLVSTSAGVTPAKADLMAFNTTAAAVGASTTWFEVLAIKPISLGALDLVFSVWVAT